MDDAEWVDGAWRAVYIGAAGGVLTLALVIFVAFIKKRTDKRMRRPPDQY